MATLSSIPESNPEAPGLTRQKHRGRSIASFERVRPRSRVVILSRRASRIRYPRRGSSAKAVCHQNRANPASDGQTSADASKHAIDAAERERISEHARRGGFPPAGRVSDRDLLTYESLVPPLDRGRYIATSSSKLPLSNTASQIRDAYLTSIDTHEQDQTALAASYQDQGSILEQSQSELDFSRSVDQEPPDRWYGDATTEVAVPKRSSRLDEELVEAVTRNVVQQLRLLSITSQPRSSDGDSETSRQPTLDQFVRTSSQNAAIDGFAKELQRYAEHTGAVGKLPVFTPTPVRSGGTLRTVSELVPFRAEFRAAGLAVTSKDQARRPPRPTKADLARAARRRPIKAKTRRLCPSRFDGNDTSVGTTTEISFITSKDVDDWRYALIDEISPRRNKQAAVKKHSLSRCIPCYPADDQTTDGECSQTARGLYQKTPGPILSKAQKSITEASTIVPKTPAKSVQRTGPNPQTSPHDASSLSIQQTVFAARPANLKQEDPDGTEAPTYAEMVHPRPAFFAGPKRHTTGGNRPQKLVAVPPRNVTVQAVYDTIPAVDSQDEAKQECVSHSMGPPDIPLKSYLRSLAQHTRPETGIKPSQKLDGGPSVHELASDLPKVPVGESPAPHDLASDVPKIPVGERPPAHDLASDVLNMAVDERPAAHDLSSDLPKIPMSTLSMPNLHVLEQDAVMKPSAAAGHASGAFNPRSKKPTKPVIQHSLSLCSRGLSSPARARPNIPRRVSSMQGSLRHAALKSDDDILDRDVLRGLHIAASAACDEQVDAFIRHKTGLQIRRFLADLMMLENLGDGRPGEDYRKHVERRRSEMKTLKQQVRRSREIRNISLVAD